MSTPLPHFELERRETPTAELTRKLLDYLLSGELSLGQKIPPERALADALGVGRAAVRHAIKSLSLLGLLEQRQGDGTYLSRSESDLLPRVIEWGLLLGERRVADLLETRHHLEIVLAGLAAERRTPEQLARLKSLIDQMATATDHQQYVEADIGFHLEVAAASHNLVLAGILSNVQSLLRVWAQRVINAAGETATSLTMHRRVLKAIEASDSAAARRAMEAHMDRAGRRLRATLKASRPAEHVDS
jgi:GntR family transcriptional repressor for pyruvate dehydrogenase complex